MIKNTKLCLHLLIVVVMCYYAYDIIPAINGWGQGYNLDIVVDVWCDILVVGLFSGYFVSWGLGLDIRNKLIWITYLLLGIFLVNDVFRFKPELSKLQYYIPDLICLLLAMIVSSIPPRTFDNATVLSKMYSITRATFVVLLSAFITYKLTI